MRGRQPSLITGMSGMSATDQQRVGSQLLWVIRSADLTLTTDQSLTKVFTGTNWAPTAIYGVRKTGAFGVAALGGLYTAASKGGNAIVAASQSWAALTGANTSVLATLALTGIQTSSVLYLSLTTGNTGALTSNVLVFGYCLD